MFYSIQGPAGAQGDAGVQGETGIQGVPGDAGADGTFNYIDRGNLAAEDFTEASLTEDGSWYDLDLSSIVGAGIRLVLLKIIIQNTAAEKPCYFRTKGYTGGANVSNFYSQAANAISASDRWVLTDSSGFIQYYFDASTWTSINITVRGWCVP